MNSFRSLVYSSTELNATGLVCRDSGFVHVAFPDKYSGSLGLQSRRLVPFELWGRIRLKTKHSNR